MTDRCPTCGGTFAPPFTAGGVCLRCAGLRLLEEESSSGAARPGVATADHVGPYELIEELGRGGMGRVYAARQEGLGRIVAVKIVEVASSRGPELELRFLREARTAARLRHPHIVAIHDFGRAGSLAYYSMDYIEGGDLSRRLRDRPFAPDEAADVIRKLAEALTYAHHEGVLHRDIKPSNILLDGDEPKLADFGLAAEMEPGDTLTRATTLMGTPHYLAPEAMRGGSAALSVASDLYALGVVLFETLTGRTPFAGATPADLPALLDRSDPPAPRLLAPAVPRDLETICLCCLEREPARRYPSAKALAEDLGRFRRREPIAARRPGRMAALAKFARRHRVGFAAGGAIALVLLAATFVSATLAVRATRSERQAATAARASQAISDFLRNDVLAQAAPGDQPDRDIKLRTVLDAASRRIDGRFPNQPLVEADLRETLADTYQALGEYGPAQAHMERALALRQAALGPDDPKTAAAMEALAAILAYRDQGARAEALARRALAALRRKLGPDDPATLHTMNDLTFICVAEGRLDAAKANATEALARSRRRLGPDHNETRSALVNLASIYWDQGDFAQAERLSREAADAEIRVLGPDHPDSLVALSNLASVYFTENKLPESEAIDRRVLSSQFRVLGPDHPDTLRSMHNLATTLEKEGKFAEAETLERRALEARRRTLGPAHTDTLTATLALASDEADLGHDADAIQLASDAVKGLRQADGPTHFKTLAAEAKLGQILLRAGRYGEAAALFRDLLAVRRRLSGPGDGSALSAAAGLGAALSGQRRFAEAESVLRDAWAACSPAHRTSLQALVLESELGEALAGLGRYREAEPLEVAACQGAALPTQNWNAVERPEIALIRRRAAQLYASWGRPQPGFVTARAHTPRTASSPPPH